jgi:hypothetical protein
LARNAETLLEGAVASGACSVPLAATSAPFVWAASAAAAAELVFGVTLAFGGGSSAPLRPQEAAAKAMSITTASRLRCRA